MSFTHPENVIINQASPFTGRLLDVQLSSVSKAWVDQDGNVFINGNVGIGTLSPITQLHVAGKVPGAQTGSVTAGATPDNVYVQGRYAYVTSLGWNTLQVLDVSNPASPVSKGSVATGTSPRGVYVQGRYAYVANWGSNTLQIFDVSNPASPSSVGTVSTGTNPRMVYVQGRYAYVPNYGSNTLQIFDVANPAAPVLVGSVAAGTSPWSVYVQGRYAYVVPDSAPGTFRTIDVSDPAAPVSVGTAAPTGGSQRGVYVQDRYAYVAEYGGNKLDVFDITNPASPSLVGSVATGTGPYSVYVQGRHAFVPCFSSNTLQIFDVANPAAPTSVGTVTTGTGPDSVFVQGRHAFVTNYNSGTLQVFDLGGSYVQQLEAGGLEAGTLQVRNNVTVNNDLDVRGGLQVGRGIAATGPFAVYGGAAGATFVVNRNGNVGMGTANPGSKLDVVGSIAVTGTVDGVDVSAHASNVNAHHGQAHGDVDHTVQYALLAGRSLGQTLIGGTGASENLQLQSTSHADKGQIQFHGPANYIDASGNLVLAGTVDGVDVSGHAANVNAHHPQGHGNADHTAAPAPSQIDIGDTAAIGGDPGPARGDHVHGFPAPAAGYSLNDIARKVR